MAQGMNVPSDSDHRPGDENRGSSKDKPHLDEQRRSSPPPPGAHRRRERDLRERHGDDREFDRRRGGDYYDRPMAYKRRNSVSPPPPYRERRYSPPYRRSPPAYKRFRREDGGYEVRRGGFGRGDRRFHRDYPGAFERGMGGRPGYADRRPRGRYMGRGYQDLGAGDGGYDGNSDAVSSQREGLMSYKQFIQELEDDVSPDDAERRYQEYKSEYISTQKQIFFERHNNEEWLKDKYHPTNLVKVIERRNELAKKVAKDFLLDLQSGTLNLGPAANSSSNISGRTSKPNSDDETDPDGKRRRHSRTTAKETEVTAAPKAHPISSEPRRIQIDIEQAQALLRKLDSEKGIGENILCSFDKDSINKDKPHDSSMGPVIIVRGLTFVKGLEGVELLDTLITYLWRVHGLDYYGMVEMTEAKGLRHVRVEGKATDVNNAGIEWEKKLDSHWQERLGGEDLLEMMTAKEELDTAATGVLDPHVRKIKDEKYGWKYGCGAKGCTKLFHAPEFVHKHLKLKHPDLVLELTSKIREDLYFQNYMNDHNAPGSTPVMQQPLLIERQQRHKIGFDRLKDDRGNHRDSQPNGDQSGDPQTDTDGPDGVNDDEPMYDDFGGQGIHVPPAFSSDIQPPPVLMPVPGAGPLGPFVPAPPEVAMRMFRERTGPSAFERLGPRPAPALLSSAQQDPRHIRSYQDLDAPEDEVTVIDYRSL